MATKEKTNKELARVKTPEFRVSYPHVFKPSSMKGTNNPPKYSITMLFEKTQDLTTIKEAIRQAKIAKFGADKSDWPEKFASPVVDGDDPKFSDNEGYKGCWAIKASSREDQRPAVVDENVTDIIDASKFYPGCYACAYVFACVWEFPKNSGKYGVMFILDGVQKLRDGKSFGGRKPVDEMFQPVRGMDDSVNDDAGEDSFF